ncbi:MAG: DNA translocase FtsK [Thermodesulfobacteriota bacterium]
MRNVLASLFLLVLSAAVAVSLLSYSPADPSIFHPMEVRTITNRFGWIGAQTAGWLIGFFGKGVLWIPVTLFLTALFGLGKRRPSVLVRTVAGGCLLAAATCVLTTMLMPPAEDAALQHSAGGVLGFRLTGLALFYTGYAGTLLLVVSGFIIGFFFLTGISPFVFAGMIRKHQVVPTAAKGRSTPDAPSPPESRPTRTTKKKSPSPPEPSETSVEPELPDIAPMTPELVLPAQQPKPKPPRALASTTASRHFTLPQFDFLNDPAPSDMKTDQEELLHQAEMLTAKLEHFGVKGRVAAITPGPVITTFEYEPAPGVKINKIVSLSDDLALALKALSIRIVAPIPGKSVIGIEIPNAIRQIVHFKEIVTSPVFAKSRSVLTVCLGKDIVGKPVVAELDRMPHLLIAGATGTGKSVGLNSMICSMLYKSTPEQVKLIMIDPKRIELSLYDGIPHLITPVVTDVKKATNALFWAVREMERRYELLSEQKCRNITQYNQKAGKTKGTEGTAASSGRLPYIVIIIDELADLMMVASRDVEVALTRLAQMARASGIHLILATQRPSVDVLTGIIKANFPTRLTFQVSSKTDSRTILDCNGAESLLGNGDMLFLPPGTAKLQRIHGAFISEEEVGRITDFLRAQMPPDYIDEVTEAPQREGEASGDEDHDERYDDAVALVTRTRQASISMIQRHLRIGYNRAARIIETMEKEGVIGPSDGVKPREVLVKSYDGMP